jgi:signal transduction histidine kinase
MSDQSTAQTAADEAGLPRPPRFRLPPRVVDALLVVAVSLPGLIVAIAEGIHGHASHTVLGLVSVVVNQSLWWRRRWSLGVLAVLLLSTVIAFQTSNVATLVALYTVGAWGPRRFAVPAGAVTAGAFLAGEVVSTGGLSVPDLISSIALAGVATVLGLYVGVRRAYVSALRERAERLHRERGLLAQRAVAEERVRIARELHDVVAHHVSLMVVQAGALEQTMPSEDARHGVAGSIATTGRQALGEMRTMLGVLRPGEATTPDLTPQPGIADIQALVVQMRSAGLPVELDVRGTPHALPPAMELSVYRIVQEALTNVVKHAGRASAHVEILFQPQSVELLVSDDGAARSESASRTAPGAGHGLVGMRERVALFGGELHAGPLPGRGFVVRAVLPSATPPDAGEPVPEDAPGSPVR